MAGLVNGPVVFARFNHPFGMCADQSGNLYIADADNHCIRKISTATGMVTTLAGTGLAGYLNGPAAAAQFNTPSDVCADDSGNVFVCDFNNQRIRKISAAGMVTTVAGSGLSGYLDGAGTVAQFNCPRGICVDQSGNLYVGDRWNQRIRKITPSHVVSTWAGGGNSLGVGCVGGYLDGSDTTARFYTPCGLAIDSDGNIFVADAFNHRIRKIDSQRYVSTLAGSGPTGQGQGGYANSSPPAGQVQHAH